MRKRGRRLVALTLAALTGLSLVGTGALAARRPAPRPMPARSDGTIDWARRYIESRGWTEEASSAGVILYVRAMRPPQDDSFWARYERRYPTAIGNFVYRSVIQRLQVNCRSGQYRALETYYFRDNNRAGPSRHETLEGRTNWETPLPDSLMESAVQWQCEPASRDHPDDRGPPPASDDGNGRGDDSGGGSSGK
jgi:hypothetical protein